MEPDKLVLIFLAILSLPCAATANRTAALPSMEELVPKLEAFLASSPSFRPTYYCLPGVKKFTPTPFTQLVDQLKAALPAYFNPKRTGNRNDYCFRVGRDTCTLTHFSMIDFLKGRKPAVKACLNLKWYNTTLPTTLNCDPIYKADPTIDWLFPEFIEMRASFAEKEKRLLEQERNLTQACFDDFIIRGEFANSRTCHRLNNYLRLRSDPLDYDEEHEVLVPHNKAELFREGVLLDLFHAPCAASILKSKVPHWLCEAYNKRLVLNCFIAKNKNSWCKMVTHGHSQSSKSSLVLQHYAHLHEMYLELRKEYEKLQRLATQCYFKYRKGWWREPECYKISWKQTHTQDPLYKRVHVFYNDMVKARPFKDGDTDYVEESEEEEDDDKPATTLASTTTTTRASTTTMASTTTTTRASTTTLASTTTRASTTTKISDYDYDDDDEDYYDY